MRRVILQPGSDAGTKESVSIEPGLHFRTLAEFDSYFQELFEKAPQTFKGYEMALTEGSERWIPVDEAVVGNWLSLKAANSPKWYIRPTNQMNAIRDHVAHEKLETVADSVLQMRAYLEEEMDEIKQRASEEIAALRGDVWALKLKLDTLEQANKSQGSEDVDIIEEGFLKGPKKTASPKLQLGSAGKLKPELFSTLVQFRIPAGTKTTSIPKHVSSCIKSLDSVPVVYALTQSGIYEPCEYVSELRDKIHREPEWESFCIGIHEEDEPVKQNIKTATSVSTASTPNRSYAAASGGSFKPSVVKHPKPWIPKPLVKTEENFPSFRQDDLDNICAKTEQMTFSEEFLAAQETPTTSSPSARSKSCAWGIPAPEESLSPPSTRNNQPTENTSPTTTERDSPDSTRYPIESHTTAGASSPKKHKTGHAYVAVADPEPVTKPEVGSIPEGPPKCNSCDKLLDKTHVHCVDCETFNCCQECFKMANQAHPKEHTFELYIYQ
ncbi:hypothetical protein B0I72DRAFT_11045 [Yarrowia lipolytica]|uniref:YALI0A13673p n=1 Tax=Yarrowia lipolytica (strain CLIB 122 / E 150) TaxID=284591 RepID=Q6CH18_YARLI|nr:YALI0A13673p [Yarrowia lipolytica CLIB122]RDW30349.1 hypothetical protein B0I72DRAFT_11045 [Yarrowia lipolytica]RDW37213.1 hypothetical protein B0I73DRAFT_10088 [Yarrowia lipolytica]RDW43591.1 hypothetical protein B0I74DRAFT_7800 [Yarrowia lipolytica]RDW50430.1 hypothetical protein B0I75DRAFT_5924 [Yarrowia lipolytica]CAG83973.1 YALI0A13673p [Yarrowia lipolytica CLIB122]|eukprot:XP_500044.1 YALI0A13673p [Yarrowia lipolytica CLIB122]